MAKTKASAKAVDFSDVKERGNFNPKHVAEGDYAATIVKVEDGESKKDGDFQYIFTIKLDKFSQHSYPYYCKLQANQLWKLRNVAVAAGMNVPKKRMQFDPNKITGKKIGVTMEDDEYEGKLKSVIAAVFPMSELAEGSLADDDSSFDEDSGPTMATDDDAEDEAASEKKSKKKDKGDKAGKKGKKKGSKENLEELDISDIG